MSTQNPFAGVLNHPPTKPKSQPRTLGNGPGQPVPATKAGRTRFPILILIDTSGSTGSGINPDIVRMQEMLHTLVDQLAHPTPGSNFEQRAGDVDIAIITYSTEPTLITPWSSARTIQLPALSAGGGTSTGLALLSAIDYVERRKQYYKNYPGAPIPYAVPHIFHLTDGSPTDVQIGDQLWTDVQQLLAQMAGTPENPYQAITHFIAPNGLNPGHTGMMDQFAQPVSGKEAMAMWTGGTSVFELNNAPDLFDSLAKVIVQTIAGHTKHAGSIHDLLKKHGGRTVRGPNSIPARAASQPNKPSTNLGDKPATRPGGPPAPFTQMPKIIRDQKDQP